MIDRVSVTDGITYLEAPQRFEAGTPPIGQAIALATAIDFVNDIGLNNIMNHEQQLVEQVRSELSEFDGVKIYSPQDSANIISFNFAGVHHSDLATLLDKQGVAVRSGHHCCQPLMDHLGETGTVRASFSVYNVDEDGERLINAIKKAKEFF